MYRGAIGRRTRSWQGGNTLEINLEGKVALVTGAGSGIGRASAIALCQAGCSVALNDLDEEALAQTAAALPMGKMATVVPGDVGARNDVARMIRSIESTLGGLDILHANAGVECYEPLEHTREPDIDRVLRVDLKGCLLCMQLAVPALRRRGGGSIVATASVQATHSMPGAVVYAAAKAGVVAAARTLAVEVGADGIRVNTVSPGVIDTPMLARDRDRYRLSSKTRSDEEFDLRLARCNVLGRVGLPSEIGAVVAYLASDLASYISGANLVVDGGFTALKVI